MENMISILEVKINIEFKEIIENPLGCKSTLVEYTFKVEDNVPAGMPFKLEISDAYDDDFLLMNSAGVRVKSVRFGCRRDLGRGEKIKRKFHFVFNGACNQLIEGTSFQVELYHGSENQGFYINDEKTHYVLR